MLNRVINIKEMIENHLIYNSKTIMKRSIDCWIRNCYSFIQKCINNWNNGFCFFGKVGVNIKVNHAYSIYLLRKKILENKRVSINDL